MLELKWRLGLRQPYDNVADHGTAQIVLRNTLGSFSPERKRLDIGTRVQIECEDSGGRVTLFTGFISHVTVDAGDWSDGRSVIHIQDIQPWLEASPARLSPISDTSADVVIDRLLDGALVRPYSCSGLLHH